MINENYSPDLIIEELSQMIESKNYKVTSFGVNNSYEHTIYKHIKFKIKNTVVEIEIKQDKETGAPNDNSTIV